MMKWTVWVLKINEIIVYEIKDRRIDGLLLYFP